MLFIAGAFTSIKAQTYVNSAAAGANDGSSWADAYTDLTAAVEATTSGDIWIVAGRYTPSNVALDTNNTFMVISSVGIYGGFAGTETSIEDRVGGNQTVLSGDINGDDVVGNLEMNRGDNIYHIMTVAVESNDPVVIDGIHFSGGNAALAGPQVVQRGAGIIAFSTINVRDCAFTENSAGGAAGIYLAPDLMGGANSSIDNCLFSNNRVTNSGCGVYANSMDSLSVTNCNFQDNITNRGALYPLFNTNLTVDNCTFTNNVNPGGFGGAMFIWASRGSISNTTFTDNASQGASAGGIYFDGRDDPEPSADNMIFDNCTFTNNSSVGFGGGILSFSSSYTVMNCDFTGNESADVGGALSMGGNGQDFRLLNTTFSNNVSNFGAAVNHGGESNFTDEGNTYTGNSAMTSGGGMLAAFGAVITMTDCEFNNNHADVAGGAISCQNDTTNVTILNSIFDGNSTNDDGSGGAINVGIVELFINDCDFQNNSAGTGGAFNAGSFPDGADPNPGNLTIINSNISNNQCSTQGAGINTNNKDMDLVSSILSFNFNTSESGAGGAISINSGDTIVMETNIINSTFANNFAGLGSAIGAFTSEFSSVNNINIGNTIFSDLEEGGNLYELEEGTPTIVSLGGNIFTDASATDFLTGTNDIGEVDFEVLFVDAEENFLLPAGSPAEDNAIVELAPATDFNGNIRIGNPDSGAYEGLSVSTEEILINTGQLTMAPNPVQTISLVTLENDWKGAVKMTIVDMNGKNMIIEYQNKNSEKISFDMDITNLSIGNYFLVMRSKDQILTTQFSKI